MEVKSEKVQAMFDRIAQTYDLTNSIITFGKHLSWKKKLISFAMPGHHALDLCTGTGDLLPFLAEKFEFVDGLDFSTEMLSFAEKYKTEKITLHQGDALNLNYPDSHFDCITISYGIRNLENLNKGLSEMYRVLKPSGQLLILESGQVGGVLKPFFRIYSDFIIPLIGRVLSGDKVAYRYLPSTASQFPYGKILAGILFENGFKVEKSESLMFGAAYIYVCNKFDIKSSFS